MKKYINKIKKYIIAEILFDILCTIFAAYIPILQKEMFDSLGGGKLSQIPVIITLFVALQMLSGVCTYFCMLFTWKGAIKFEAILKRDFISALLRKNEQSFYAYSTSDYISLQGNDITALEQDYLQPWIDVFRSVNMFVIYAVVIVVYVDWRIALAIIFSSFLVVAGPKITGKIVSDKRMVYQNQMAEYVNRITDILNGYKLVNNFTRDQITKVHEDTLNRTAERRYAYGKSKTASLSINEIAIKIIQIVSFICACILLIKGEISIGAGVATFSYVSSFISPLESILYDVNTIQSTNEVQKKFLDIINSGIRGDLPIPQKVETGISLHDIDFQNGAFHMKIDQLYFDKGKKYALVGSNGCGKSTLLKLIMQYLKPDSGEIRLDGKPIDTLDTSACISYIDQNEYIYRAGLDDNVTIYGSYPNVSKQILDNFWHKKQDNREDIDCQKMSGGEKQIIAFLRVVARDTPIVLMDEPFSAMDVANTEKIQEFLLHSREMADKTVIIITHDVSEETLAKYDKVIRVNEFRC
ncbi:MAG: ABC transporter ATP-binding protein/permease [Lachnospiraceae bacterium]|nr:ABC transporter ATP-binding protein/permease [Lachnospiraceae bacterium]MDE7204507.1 ABC transporter ATP-binding protein/permease [Lachnospiraceae bacterium]